jgi:hypothetical protein
MGFRPGDREEKSDDDDEEEQRPKYLLRAGPFAGKTFEEIKSEHLEDTKLLEKALVEFRANNRKYKAAEKAKTLANRSIRRHSNLMKQMQYGGIAQTSDQISKSRQHHTQLFKNVRATSNTKKSLYRPWQDTAQKIRELKERIYIANKILQNNGVVGNEASNNSETFTLPPVCGVGLWDVEKNSLPVFETLMNHGNNGPKTVRLGIGGSDLGHVFMNTSVAVGGKKALEIAQRFAIACKNRFEVLADNENVDVDEGDDPPEGLSDAHSDGKFLQMY